MSRKIVVGMSGRIDPFAAAWLLKEQGCGVIGVIMRIWQDGDAEAQEVEGGRCGLSVVDDVRRVTMDLGIPYYVMNFKEEFRKSVMDYFAGEYAEGRMPSPHITCSRHVKWESPLRRNMAIGADHIATGHYTQIDSLPKGRYSLKTSVTAAKDRTYALYNLVQERLSHTLISVGSYHKEEMRDITERLGLLVAYKPDSQEICFIPDHNYAPFIEEYTGKKLSPGNFADLDGDILGRHRGITHYTTGQGKGSNLSMNRPVPAMEIRPETNEVAIDDNQDVFTNVLRCSKLNQMAAGGPHEKPMDVLTKIRYSRKGNPCTIRKIGYDMVECRSHESVRAVTPRRAAVLYDGDYVAGGSTIIRWNGR